MIPKIIHYCWFGGKDKPPLAEKCMKSWRKFCPDYEIREWNEQNFDIDSAPLYVRQAYEAKRWAFVTDYVRLVALTQVGGIYLDTDVEIIKPLTPFLSHEAFAGFENAKQVQTGMMACRKGFALFEDFLDYYHTAHFIKPDGNVDTTTNVEVLTQLCMQRGMVCNNTYQLVDGFAIYPKEVFCPIDFDTMKLKKTRKTVMIHWFSGSWHTEEELRAMREEKNRMRHERISNLRYSIGCHVFGEAGYAKVKSFFKR